MKYAFHPEAEAEFLHAIDYYEKCEPGLGYDFALEVQTSIKSILSFPRAWTILEADIRRCQTSRFPYGICHSCPKSVFEMND
jgi:toxin ParE1/3/4